MAFTMHSHSGQFCPGHAQDMLEDIIKHAISVGMKTMGLTEHMPRTQLEDLYPEELEPDPHASLAALAPRHEAYLAEATRLRAKYAGQIHILVGFEGEWLRGSAYGPLAAELAAASAEVDYVVGSVHHACDVPIDVSGAHYARAVAAAGGSEELLYTTYFDAQHAMLRALQPRVVGHFDLVRLLSADPARDLRACGWPAVWRRVRRNLELVAAYGGWLECNASALRKGLAEPYPARPVAEEWLRLGGRFTFSDDSHGIAQVATNYHRALDYLESLGVAEVWTLERSPHPAVEGGRKAELKEKSVTLKEFRESLKMDR